MTMTFYSVDIISKYTLVVVIKAKFYKQVIWYA